MSVTTFAVFVPIIVAMIGGPLMWMLHRLDKRNTEQHGNSMNILTGLQQSITEVSTDVKVMRSDVKSLKKEHKRLSHEHKTLARRMDEHERGKN